MTQSYIHNTSSHQLSPFDHNNGQLLIVSVRHTVGASYSKSVQPIATKEAKRIANRQLTIHYRVTRHKRRPRNAPIHHTCGIFILKNNTMQSINKMTTKQLVEKLLFAESKEQEEEEIIEGLIERGELDPSNR